MTISPPTVCRCFVELNNHKKQRPHRQTNKRGCREQPRSSDAAPRTARQICSLRVVWVGVCELRSLRLFGLVLPVRFTRHHQRVFVFDQQLRRLRVLRLLESSFTERFEFSQDCGCDLLLTFTNSTCANEPTNSTCVFFVVVRLLSVDKERQSETPVRDREMPRGCNSEKKILMRIWLTNAANNAWPCEINDESIHRK